MSYPSEILPNINYKYIECNVLEHKIIRYTETNNVDELIEPNTQKIKEGHICSPREHIADLSTSLLGIFNLSHLQIELTPVGKNEYGSYCRPNLKVKAPTKKTHYLINENRHYWWLVISEIHQKTVVFSHDKIEYRAECRVEHSPMMWNYWHFSVRWYIEDIGYCHEIQDEKLRKKLSGKLGHEARSFVKMFAEIKQPEFEKVEKSCYCLN